MAKPHPIEQAVKTKAPKTVTTLPRTEAHLDAALFAAMSEAAMSEAARTEAAAPLPGPASSGPTTDQMVAAIADQLCGIVKDDYDLRVSVDTDVDNTNIQKLTLLINALLENVRRNIGSLSELANALETKIRERTLKLDLIVQGSNDGVWIWNLTDGATEYSPRWRQILGLESEALDHIEHWLTRVHPDDSQRLRAALSAHLQGATQFVHVDYRIRHADGTYRWMWCRGKCHRNDVGRAVLMAGTQTDVHEMRSIDAATGLQNELTLVTNMEALIKGGIPFRAMVIGLPRVVTMKEELNTSEIEALRASIAQRLAASLPFGVDLARLTGDYYAAAVPCDRSESCDPAQVAAALNRAFERPFLVTGRTIWLDLNIGATMPITQTTVTAADVMRDAWTSYRCARTDGKRLNVLSDEQVVAARDRAMMEQQIRMALDNDWFVPFFQPIVDLGSGKTAGFEVLARMDHPKLGLIPPGRFLPVAEAIGVIGDVSMVMLRRAVEVLAGWSREDTRTKRLFLSVNLEAAQIMHETFVENLATLLRTSGVNPGNLKLEIVESSVISNFSAAARQMLRLRKLGVKIALDDFGTGYSSLEYLNQLDFDLIKIDKTFMDSIETDVRKKSMVRMMCVLADLLGAEVCVEGIEHDGQAEIARALNVGLAQGYLYSKPLPLDLALKHAATL